MAKFTLEDWVREAMNDGDPLNGGQQLEPLRSIALVQRMGGGMGGPQKEIYVIKLNGRAWKAAEIASIMQKKAEHYAQDASSVQWFALLAFYGDAGDPKNEHPFLVNIQSAGEFFSEGPDNKGQTSQAMRHLEESQKQVYGMQQHLNEFLGRSIREFATREQALLTENREMFGVVKEMIMERVTNNHEQKMREMAYERTSELYSKAMKMLPALANTITGRDMFPQSTADTALVEAFVEGLSEEDVPKLASVIKPELLGPLMARATAHFQKKREEQAARRALAPTSGNPESDAGGGS